MTEKWTIKKSTDVKEADLHALEKRADIVIDFSQPEANYVLINGYQVYPDPDYKTGILGNFLYELIKTITVEKFESLIRYAVEKGLDMNVLIEDIDEIEYNF